MDWFVSKLTADNIMLVSGWIVFVFTLVERFYAMRKAGQTTAEAITVLVNTLKVEDKMLPSGAFKPELVEKVGKVAETLDVSKEAKDKAREILSNGQQDIKIGSINGQPIYLGQIGGLVGVGGVLAKKVRDIRKGIKL